MKTLALALSLLTTVAHGAVEFDGSTEYATASTTEVTAAPFTVCCYAKLDTLGVTHTFVSFGDTAGTSNWFRAGTATFTGSTSAIAYDGSQHAALSSTGFTVDVWAPACAVFTNTTNRSAFFNGGSKGTNTNNHAPASIDATGLAIRHTSTDIDFLDGELAECGVWSDALADDEILQFQDKYAPPCISRSTLIAYYPLVTVEDGVTLHDFASATSTNLTVAGTPTNAAHPRVTQCH